MHCRGSFFYVTTGGLGRFIVYNVIGGKEGYKLSFCALECSASTVTSIESKLLFEVPPAGTKTPSHSGEQSSRSTRDTPLDDLGREGAGGEVQIECVDDGDRKGAR